MTDRQQEGLSARKRVLADRLERIRKDLSGNPDTYFSEQAVLLENRDILLEIARVTEGVVRRINEQLSKS